MIELKGISKTYQSKGVKVEALRGVTLTLPERGMVFVVGKSGSGKSTLLNILGGLDSPTSGEMLVDGISVKEFRSRDYDAYRNDYVGFVFQEYNLIDSLTVEENVELALNLRGEKDAKAVGEVLDRVELSGYGTRKISSLSGGQKQRVAIARALIKRPKLLIADEPTGALDSETGNSLFRLLKELSKEVLVVVVSHDLDFAHTYGDRIVELADGRVIADSGEEKEVAAPRRAVFDRKKPLTVGKAIKLGLKGVRKNPVRFAISIVLCSISLLMFGVGAMMSQYDHDRVLGETLLAYDDGVLLHNIDHSYFTPNELEKIAARYPRINFKPVYDGECGVQNYRDAYLRNNWNSSLTEIYYQISVSSFCELTELELKTFNYEIVAGRLPEDDGEVAIPLYQYEILAEMTNQEKEDQDYPYTENYEDVLGTVMNGGIGSPLTVVGIIDTKIDPQYSILRTYTLDNFPIEEDDQAARLFVQDFFQMAEDSIQFCCFLPEGYFDRHLKDGIRFIGGVDGKSSLYFLTENWLGEPEYRPFDYFIAYDDLSETDLGMVYAPEYTESSNSKKDGVIISFARLLSNQDISNIYHTKRIKIIDDYITEQIDSLLENPSFLAEYEASEESSAENFYYNSLFSKYYYENPYGKPGIDLYKNAQAETFDLVRQSLTQFTFYKKENNEALPVTKIFQEFFMMF